jgi:hypothetical protein
MTYHFTSKGRVQRDIADDDDKLVGAVVRTPTAHYYLLDQDKKLMRKLPFSGFDGALKYFSREYKYWIKQWPISKSP